MARKTAVFVLVMGVVALGGWFGRKAYKKSVERRLLAEAKTFLARKDARNTALCLRRALQVNPYSLDASVMMADMLEQMRVPAAISWRNRAVQLAAKEPDLRLAWATTALRFQDFVSAKSALDGLDDHTKSGAPYYKLAGVLAWETSQPSEAEKWYQQALRLEPTNLTIAFNLATIHLTSTNRTVSDSARVSLERMTTNADFKLRALRYLKADAAARRELSTSLRYSSMIVCDPGVTLGDRVDHLELLRSTKSSEFESWRSGLDAEAKRSPATAFALGQWMLTAEGPTNALGWLKNLPPNVQTNQPVPLLLADCYLFLDDWNGLLALVQKQDWGDGNCFRLALEARAQRAKDDLRGSQTTWSKAVNVAAHDLDKLVRLTQLSSKWGWSSEHLDLLRRITSEFPNQRWAADGLIAELYALGNSRALAEFLSKSLESDPTNAKLKNNLAAVSLLRKSGLETAYRLAREAYSSSPENPVFMSTYAYALLLQNKTNDAEKIVSEIKPEYRKIPSIAAYYGVVEAEAGHKDAAREALQRAQTASLLPEEKEMVRLASSHL